MGDFTRSPATNCCSPVPAMEKRTLASTGSAPSGDSGERSFSGDFDRNVTPTMSLSPYGVT